MSIVKSGCFGDLIRGHLGVLRQEDRCAVEAHVLMERLRADPGLRREQADERVGGDVQEISEFVVWDEAMSVR